MSRYYVAWGSVPRGPFEMRDLPGQGLGHETLVWKEGMRDWKRADEVEEIIFSGLLMESSPAFEWAAAPGGAAGFAAPAVAPIAPPYFAGAASSRIPAGVCAILLGGLGIHKFILGRVGAGLVMLLLTVLTCGWLAPVMHLIGIIEGLIYLTRTDEQFYLEYVVGRKGWL